jgi:hypothetical protein
VKRALGGTFSTVAVIVGFTAFVVEPVVGLACVAPLAGGVFVGEVALEPVYPLAPGGVVVVVALVLTGGLEAVCACPTVLVFVLDPQPAATSARTMGILRRDRLNTVLNAKRFPLSARAPAPGRVEPAQRASLPGILSSRLSPWTQLAPRERVR